MDYKRIIAEAELKADATTNGMFSVILDSLGKYTMSFRLLPMHLKEEFLDILNSAPTKRFVGDSSVLMVDSLGLDIKNRVVDNYKQIRSSVKFRSFASKILQTKSGFTEHERFVLAQHSLSYQETRWVKIGFRYVCFEIYYKTPRDMDLALACTQKRYLKFQLTHRILKGIRSPLIDIPQENINVYVSFAALEEYLEGL